MGTKAYYRARVRKQDGTVEDRLGSSTGQMATVVWDAEGNLLETRGDEALIKHFMENA